MSTTESTNGAITAAVRERLAAAAENKQPLPGRRRLAADLGVTVYRIRQAIADLAQAPTPDPAPPTTGPRAPRWPLLLLALPAFVSIWGGWVGLGRLTGFGPITLLPGIWDDLEIDSAITLPIGLETYAAYALYIWLSGIADAGARRFAKISALTSLAVGAAGQIAYHLMQAHGITAAPWPITTLVATLPVAVLGMGAALAHLIARTDPVGAHLRPPHDLSAPAPL